MRVARTQIAGVTDRTGNPVDAARPSAAPSPARTAAPTPPSARIAAPALPSARIAAVAAPLSRIAALAPSPARIAAPAVAVLFAAASAGCGAIATSPAWTGGGLAVSAPMREAEEDAAAARRMAEIARQPKEIGAKHILVMHAQSKGRPEGVTRTREEARKRAQECLLLVRSGQAFDDVVKTCSDEPGAAERGGDLGVFERTVMVKPFSDAAFALKVGEVSEVVETAFGFHIIKRTE